MGGNLGRREDPVADPGQINLPTCGIQLGLPHIALSGKVTRVWHPGNAVNCQQLSMVTCSPLLVSTVSARPTHLSASASESNLQLHVPRFSLLNI